jgi:hypothetical protein
MENRSLKTPQTKINGLLTATWSVNQDIFVFAFVPAMIRRLIAKKINASSLSIIEYQVLRKHLL